MKTLLVYLLLLFSSVSLFGQEPLIKYYLTDGSTKQYNINDIDNMTLIHSNLSYSIKLYQKGDIKNEIDIRLIDSIIFEDQQIINIFQSSEIQSYDISTIDSIIFVFNTCTEIQIGFQIWMCKNLDVDHYRNGDPIPHVTDPTQWKSLRTGAWCYFNNDPDMGAIYGKLYNWYAVNDPRGLAPDGWHVATDAEWTILTNYLGGVLEAGGKLKEAGTAHWNHHNEGATNKSGFSALPGGWRYYGGGAFSGIGCYGYWWSATEVFSNAWYRGLFCGSAYVSRYDRSEGDGLSVRCVRD